MYVRIHRDRFCNILDRYWTRFATTWDVLLHGNPAAEIYHGIKLAAGGELGIGVGEEEWGSGEREVFEDFAGRTDGLVDMVVSRFGVGLQDQDNRGRDTVRSKKPKPALTQDTEPWMGCGHHPGPGDGVVFSGVGAVSKKSLNDVTDWVQTLYAYGDHAYGVKDNPGSDRRKRRKRDPPQPQNGHVRPPPRRSSTRDHPTIPPPIIAAAEQSLDRASAAASASAEEGSRSQSPAHGDKWTKYLTLGYGSSWGPGSSKESTSEPGNDASAAPFPPEAPAEQETRHRAHSMQYVEPEPEGRSLEDKINAQIRVENEGHFIIGLKGGLDDELEDDPSDDEGTGGLESNNRTLLRTLYVEVLRPPAPTRQLSSESRTSAPTVSDGKRKYTRLRIVVYVVSLHAILSSRIMLTCCQHRPFIYTFLFHPRTDSLAMPSFYRNLHTFFAPLHRPLSSSTDPTKVAARLAAASPLTSTFSPSKPSSASDADQQPIFDLIFDPGNMTLHTSIPNVPEPGTFGAEGLAVPTGIASTTQLPPWTRVEALNVHSQILSTVCATRRADADGDIERSEKTSRGWWVVWMKVNAAYLDNKTGAWHANKGEIADDQAAHEIPAHIEDAAGNTDAASATASAKTLSSIPPDIPQEGTATSSSPSLPREAILIRRARDAGSTSSKSGGSRAASGMWTLGLGSTGTSALRSTGRDDPTGGAAAGWGPARLAEGIGVDARRYVEGLLSLNR